MITSISFRMYLTANLLIAFIPLFTNLPFSLSILASCTMVAFSLIFSIPSGFALYYCLKLVALLPANTKRRWLIFITLLSLVASVPYLFVSGLVSGTLVCRELRSVLFISEATAFLATLIYRSAIHQLFKYDTNEHF